MTMTLLQAFIKERWHFVGHGKLITPALAETIGGDINEDVVEIAYDYKVSRRTKPLCFHHYIGTKHDIVLWASPVINYAPRYAGLLFGEHRDFLNVCERLLEAKHIPKSDQNLILGSLRAEHARALGKAPSLAAAAAPQEMSSSLDLA